MSSGLAYRDADPSEDDELARILYNAFLPIWNHNWFQCLTEPLDVIPSTSSPRTQLQSRRLAFYRSWIALTRAHNGDVIVAYTPNTSDSPDLVAAVCLLLPPHARPSWSEPLLGWRVGLLPALLGFGLRGLWRVCGTFEGNVGRMITEGLKERGVADGKEVNLLFCQGCVRNPHWEGERGPARKLLDWGIKRYWERDAEKAKAKGEDPGKKIPVWLDTTIDEGVRAYEDAGFKVVGECMVKTDADAKGIRLRKDASGKDIEEGRKIAKQRVMLRMPPES